MSIELTASIEHLGIITHGGFFECEVRLGTGRVIDAECVMCVSRHRLVVLVLVVLVLVVLVLVVMRLKQAAAKPIGKRQTKASGGNGRSYSYFADVRKRLDSD